MRRAAKDMCLNHEGTLSMKHFVRNLFIINAAFLVLFSCLAVCVYAQEKITVRMEDNETAGVTMVKGEQALLEVTSSGLIQDPSVLHFKSSKKKVAKVTKTGVVKAKKKGKTFIRISDGKRIVSLKITVKSASDASEGSKGAGKITCSGGNVIKTGKVITLKLNKTAAAHDWTWQFTGTCAKDARILNGNYKKSGKITFTVWPCGGTLAIVGNDPLGYTIRYSFNVKQTSRWKKREMFRNEALSGITPDMSPAQMILYFCDYIADRASYESGTYFSIIDGKNGDCVSYSAAFRYLAEAVGIETITVKNNGSRSHYWNQVKLDGVWYNVDAQGYDTSRTRKWVLSSDERHGWYASTVYSAQNGIQYPVSPANVCLINYKE